MLLLCSLTACGFIENIFDKLEDKAEATAKVEEMMTALTENRIDDAKALMHPDASEMSDTIIAQMRDYIAGRQVESIEMTGINVHVSKSTTGSIRKEDVSYEVALSDGETINLEVVYVSDVAASGFYSFQLVLGVV